MAKKASDKPSASAEEALKHLKKQARREAKLMMEIEEANKDLKKAQKKQSKAQARLEEQSTYVHTLEAKLEELRAPTPEPAIEMPLQTVQSLSASKSHPRRRSASHTLMGTNRPHLKKGPLLLLA